MIKDVVIVTLNIFKKYRICSFNNV